MMVMVGILDVALALIVLLLFLWIVSNLVRYLAHGNEGKGWWGLSEGWIKNKKKGELKNGKKRK